MRLVRLSTMGILLQALLLAGFILVARTDTAQIGKSAVVALAFLTMGALLLYASRALSGGALVSLCFLLAVGYTVGFHLLGVLFFPGLLKDVDWSSGYLLSTLAVTAAVFALYAFASLLAKGIQRLLPRKR